MRYLTRSWGATWQRARTAAFPQVNLKQGQKLEVTVIKLHNKPADSDNKANLTTAAVEQPATVEAVQVGAQTVGGAVATSAVAAPQVISPPQSSPTSPNMVVIPTLTEKPGEASGDQQPSKKQSWAHR